MRTDHPRRRLLALTAIGALSVTVGLASCGDDDDTSSDTTPATIAVASTAESTTATSAPRATTTSPGSTGRTTTTAARAGGATATTAERPTTTAGRSATSTTAGSAAGGTAGTTTTVASGAARTASATAGSGPEGSASGESAPPTTAGECDQFTTNAQYPLKLCDTGYDVLLVQQALAAQGFDVPTSGDFDPATDAAVRAYQEQFGLTVDGLVGRETWTHLVPDAPGQDNNGNGVVDPFEVTTG